MLVSAWSLMAVYSASCASSFAWFGTVGLPRASSIGLVARTGPLGPGAADGPRAWSGGKSAGEADQPLDHRSAGEAVVADLLQQHLCVLPPAPWRQQLLDVVHHRGRRVAVAAHLVQQFVEHLIADGEGLHHLLRHLDLVAVGHWLPPPHRAPAGWRRRGRPSPLGSSSGSSSSAGSTSGSSSAVPSSAVPSSSVPSSS